MTDPLRIERVIGAPPEAVFAAFVTREGQEAFYGTDEPGWIVESDCDLRVGGLWTVTFGPSRDHLYRHSSIFRVVDPPRRLVLATTESRPDRPGFSFSVEFAFAPHDAGTRMTMTQSGFPSEDLREEHGRGVPHALDRLERVLGTRN